MRIVACEILRKEFESVAPQVAGQATWLPAGLHVNLDRLGEALEGALPGTGAVACLYGACHPDIDTMVASASGCRLPGKDCIAAFLTAEDRRQLEGRKAFVITPGWLRHWREIFRDGQGWDEIDARQNFGFYDVVILLDFGVEPIDDMSILEFFDYTQTPVEVVPASLEHFQGLLRELLGDDTEEHPNGETGALCFEEPSPNPPEVVS
jgi:hypothetical protein